MMPGEAGRPLRHRVLATVLAVLAVAFGLVSILLLWQSAAAFRRQTETQAAAVGRTVAGAIRTVMLNGRGDLASEVIEDLRSVSDVRRVEVYRTDGTEAFKDLVTLMDVVSVLNAHGEFDRANGLYRHVLEHRRGQVEPAKRLADPQLLDVAKTGQPSSREELLNEEHVLTYFLPLKNDQACQRCHGREHLVRGVIVLSVSTTPIRAGLLQGSALLGVSLGVIALAIGAGLMLSIGSVVLRPLESLVEALQSEEPGLALARMPPSTTREFAALAQTLRESVARVESAQSALAQSEKLAGLGQLAAGVAHELNNPLTVVTGQAAILRQTLRSGPVVERAAKIALAAERCARIVKNFLALARHAPPERHRVSLNEVVQEAVELLAYPLRVDDVEVRLDLAADLPVLWADPHQLHQVVVNLVTNAHQAMRASPVPRRQIALTTRCDSGRRLVLLEVRDTGPGIPREIQSRIWEPFFTTKPSGQGTGLGLSLCQGIVKSHGGIIRVESHPGQGTMFCVELPVETTVAEEPDARTADAPLLGKAILVVDDEPEVADVMAELLAGDGHHVETAAGGVQALDKIRTRSYDLIFTDIKMPDLDGPGLYRQLERLYPQLRRRVIFVTGDTLSAETQAFLEQSNPPVLSKPFLLEEIRQAVHRALRAP